MERHKEIKKSSLIKNDSKYESAIKKLKWYVMIIPTANRIHLL